MVRELAGQIGDPGRIDAALRSVWNFVPDPDGVEYVAAPDVVILRAMEGYQRSGAFVLSGDCDEAATLAGALLAILDTPGRLVAIRQANMVEFSHVFVRWAGGDIDPTVPETALPLTRYVEAMELPI